MRKMLTIAAAAATAAAGIALAANYSAVSLPAPGVWNPAGIGVAKVAAIQIEGAHPANGTVIISRISKDGAATNALLTRTCSSGAFSGDIGAGTNIYLFAGDRLLRSGTATNECSVMLILNN
ncbi:MAG TPA: hypothetical protein PLZ74_01770 [Kiritimatiellia bacterium]|jgi:hypothetical protein|nr:hypothetical protein [Kiritimatiellia bacterium]HRS37310.1 hypothetical protein [Thermoanaerobaculia bacterium]